MIMIEKIILKEIRNKINSWFLNEKKLVDINGCIEFTEDSPEKSWPDPDKIAQGGEVPFSIKNIPLVGKSLRSSVTQGELAVKNAFNLDVNSHSRICDNELADFIRYAKRQGIGDIGFTEVPRKLIFRDRAVLYKNAIVLTMEMDRVAISKAPSVSTFRMVMSTYDRLGMITNKLADYLKKRGHNAHSSHPLGGLIVYPPLAARAGLGWLGKHGLLISDKLGPRQRISAIFTDIDRKNVCDKCNRCVKSCPTKAILKKPIKHETGQKTCIERDKCLPQFVKKEGCSICIQACPYANASKL